MFCSQGIASESAIRASGQDRFADEVLVEARASAAPCVTCEKRYAIKSNFAYRVGFFRHGYLGVFKQNVKYTAD